MGLPAVSLHARHDGADYRRHRPETTVLYQLVESDWPAFRERAEQSGGLPKFVTREFDEYLRCGRLEHGCVRVACTQCGFERLVAFSCKRRGFCPSCLGRRMTDTAVHLVERVLPEVRIRQWVCSPPFRLRVLLGYERRLCGAVLGAFVGELTRSMRRRAQKRLGLARLAAAQTGSVTFIQRFDAGLRLNVHFHTLCLDGVYVREPAEDAGGRLVFHELPTPTASSRSRPCCPWSPADVARLSAPMPMAAPNPPKSTCCPPDATPTPYVAHCTHRGADDRRKTLPATYA